MSYLDVHSFSLIVCEHSQIIRTAVRLIEDIGPTSRTHARRDLGALRSTTEEIYEFLSDLTVVPTVECLGLLAIGRKSILHPETSKKNRRPQLNVENVFDYPY